MDDEPIAVRPRYRENEEARAVVAQPQPVLELEPEVSKTTKFMSMLYDNRIIIGVIFVVIVICFVAYFVLKKTADPVVETTKTEEPPKKPQDESPPPAQAQAPPSAPPPTEEPVTTKPDKSKLQAMLAESVAVTSQPGSKSESEIAQFLETASDVLEYQEEEHNEEPEPVDEEKTPAVEPAIDPTCSIPVNGRKCKGKVTKDGKCRIHQNK